MSGRRPSSRGDAPALKCSSQISVTPPVEASGQAAAARRIGNSPNNLRGVCRLPEVMGWRGLFHPYEQIRRSGPVHHTVGVIAGDIEVQFAGV